MVKCNLAKVDSRVRFPLPAPYFYMAPWPSGKARVCKTLIPGSNPGGASNIKARNHIILMITSFLLLFFYKKMSKKYFLTFKFFYSFDVFSVVVDFFDKVETLFLSCFILFIFPSISPKKNERANPSIKIINDMNV